MFEVGILAWLLSLDLAETLHGICLKRGWRSPPLVGKMAARRLARSAVDWVAFKERVPLKQQEFYRAFKAKNDAFINK